MPSYLWPAYLKWERKHELDGACICETCHFAAVETTASSLLEVSSSRPIVGVACRHPQHRAPTRRDASCADYSSPKGPLDR